MYNIGNNWFHCDTFHKTKNRSYRRWLRIVMTFFSVGVVGERKTNIGAHDANNIFTHFFTSHQQQYTLIFEQKI